MRITEEQWNTIIGPKIMSLPGMMTTHHSDFIADGDSIIGIAKTYIRFMSDYGTTDNNNGKVLYEYLKANNCDCYRHRPRAVVVNDEDIARLFL